MFSSPCPLAVLATAVVATATLLLAACGADRSDAGTGAGEAAGSVAAATAEPSPTGPTPAASGTTTEPSARPEPTTTTSDPVTPEPTTTTSDPTTPTPEVGDEPERLTARVLDVRPHDPLAFTQGLVVSDGRMFESTGDREPLGTVVREVDPLTGEVIDQVSVDGVFGEGLELVGDSLYLLTWRGGQLIVLDADTLDEVRRVGYEGEGWGLCSLGDRLAMSDGTDMLTFRDPDSFDVVSDVAVTVRGEPLEQINELECVDGNIWANVWFADQIVRIDPATGVVTAVVDTSSLDRSDLPEDPTAVLNGIAYDESTGTFLLTGKLWPSMFEVVFDPA